MTLTNLPAFELYEEGSQIRRSVKSVKSNIVEGYGRRRYKQDYIRFLTYSQASCDETTDHLETLYETASLKDEAAYESLHQRLQTLRNKIARPLHSDGREGAPNRRMTDIQHPETSIQHRCAEPMRLIMSTCRFEAQLH